MGATITGRIFVTDEHVNKLIYPEELDYYLQKGWRKGRAGQNPSKIPCKGCNKLINFHDGKSGMCRNCLKKSGFYEDQWKNPEYRKKVIEGATGKKRSDEFKKKQSENMKKHYQEHPERRASQGEVFSKAWAEGKHSSSRSSGYCAMQHSKAEEMMYNALCNEFCDHYVRHCILKNNERTKIKSIYPDAIVYNRVIFEYNGDYFHGNPYIYEADDIVSYGYTAKEIWDRDSDRKDLAYGSFIGIDLDTGEEFNPEVCLVITIWEHDTLHLTTQDEWNAYIHDNFLGLDEYLSV